MADGRTFLQAFVEHLRQRAARGGPDAPAAAILWPDEARQWEPLIPLLRPHLPIVTLGPWTGTGDSGPAYWVRCIVDRSITVPDLVDGIPVVYLPGFARTDVRAVEDAPETLKPLAELQYRGVIVSQLNGKDLTITSFLESESGGLGIDVADDAATRDALLRARERLAEVTLDELRRVAPLKAAFFDGLLAPDLDREVLHWIDDRSAFEGARSPAALEAFRAQVAGQLGASLDDGEIGLARRLGLRGGGWGRVWQRYTEAPSRYPGVEGRLAAARPDRPKGGPTLFEGALGSWPQDNIEEEERLRTALLDLASLPAATSRERILALEAEHGPRRGWVWAQLGRAPLALAVGHLAGLACATRDVPAPASVEEAMRNHAEAGWRADDAVIQALACVRTEADRSAVTAAARSVYAVWLDELARRFQAVVGGDASAYRVTPLPDWPTGTALVFFDGFRMDIARRLEGVCRDGGRDVALEPRLTALPTITSTAKPAVSPVVGALGPGRHFAPSARAGGADLTIDGLRKLLADAGWQVLTTGETGDPTGRAWTELGDLDEDGHLQPDNLPEQSFREVEKLSERIGVLLDAGWKQVIVVTDHGWLYLPGGLPKVDFPTSVTPDDRGRKGRTARLADGAQAPGATVPWTWDPAVRMAVAPGIATFVAGAVYEHGGVSPQECITPVVTVRNSQAPTGPVGIEVRWAGLRARVTVRSAPAGATFDVRRKAGDAETTLIGGGRPAPADTESSVLVVDEDAEGTGVFVVVHDGDGRPLGQTRTTVGGGD